MNRRTFIRAAGAAAAVSWLPWPAQAASARGERRLLVLVELKGGNDGFNTLVPYTDAEYYRLRPSVAIPREQVLSLDARAGLHPELRPLLTRYAKERVGGERFGDWVAHAVWTTTPAAAN